MKNLFIDSNIWLSLYHFTNDDLAQFSKLKDMVNKSIRLFVPQQVYDEIVRNREAKLKDALKSFEVNAFRFPAFCKGYSECQLLLTMSGVVDYIIMSNSVYALCPKCDDVIEREYMAYCSGCGQRLDWRGYEKRIMRIK